MEYAVRQGGLDDLPEITDIYNHYVINSPATFELEPRPWQDRVPWLREHSGNGPHRLLVALDAAENIVGWATTSEYRTRAAYSTTVEASVYCRHDCVGRGIGKKLYTELFASIINYDVERIVAGITMPNPLSVSLHRSMGFTLAGTLTRVGRKFGKFWDVSWFERPARPGQNETEPNGRNQL